MSTIEKKAAGAFAGLPHAPAWDFPGAAAIRAERMRAHMEMAAALRRLAAAEAEQTEERKERFRRAGGYRRPDKRRMTPEQIVLFAKLQEAARTLPEPTGLPGTAFPRLDLIGETIVECEEGGLPRAYIASTVRCGVTSLREWLRAQGFGRLPPGRKAGGKNIYI